MSKDYIFEPRPIFSSYTPNLLLGSYYIEDGFQADPSMWMDPLEDAFVNNAGMKVGKDDNENFYLNDFSAEAVLMGTKKLDALEVIPQSPSWKWANYDNELQIPKDIADDDFESAAYERFMEAAVGYNSDDPYFLSVVNSFMDDGEDVDLWAEEADWNRIQTTVLWWKLYDQWMEDEGIDFLTGYAEENYDWAVTHSYELGNIGYEMPEPDDDDYYWSMRQAESRHWSYDKPMTERQRYRIRKLGGRIDKSMNRSDASRYIKSLMVNPLHAENESHWMTFGRVDYNWATDPDDLELEDEDFWVIDEHIRNEVRYEIDTNNLPGESNISSSDISLSLTEEDEDDFTIYYYWGPAETTGVNSAESSAYADPAEMKKFYKMIKSVNKPDAAECDLCPWKGELGPDYDRHLAYDCPGTSSIRKQSIELYELLEREGIEALTPAQQRAVLPAHNFRAESFGAEYCEECSYREHDACPIIEGCPCCDNTRRAMMDAESFEAKADFALEYSRLYEHELWREGDMRLVADYDEDFWSHNVEGWFDDDEEYEAFRKRVGEHGVYVLTLEKQVQGEWERLDSVRGTVPNENLTLMDIAKEQFDFKEVESFEAPYTGAGALMGISGDSDLSSFTSKELTESSAIHGDFDQASLNYSGHQNLEVRAEAVWDDEDYYDHEAAWERIFEVWMEEWVTGGATSRDILKIYAAKNGFWDYEEVDVTTATAWYDGLTIADREDEIIGADPFNLVGLSSADPAELKKKVALFEALKEIIEDQMDSWDDQFQ